METDRRHWDCDQQVMVVEEGAQRGDFPDKVADELACKYCGAQIKICNKGMGGPLLCRGFVL